VNTAKIAERLEGLEARASKSIDQGVVEYVGARLTEAEKSIMVAQYVHEAYGNLEGWDFSTIDADYSRVSAKIKALRKEAANGPKDL
jgi:hypothetical protein